MLSYSGTIVPTANFNAERGAIKLQKAMKGLGSDEKVIIEVLTSHSNAQRQEIKKKYKALYGRELSDDIAGELGGHFEELCLALLAPHHQYLVDWLHKIITGGTDGDRRGLVEILTPLQSNEAAAIANLYQEKHQSSLDGGVKDGWLKGLLQSLSGVSGGANGTEMAHNDAQQLQQAASEGEVESFIKVLSNRRQEELRAIFDLYPTIEDEAKVLLANHEGQLAYLTLIQIVRNECDYMAERLHSCLQGLNSDDVTLIRILTVHSETNLGEIKERYRVMYGKELAESVTDDTSGDYRKLLLKILG